MKKLFFIIYLLVFSMTVQATTYYVSDKASSEGKGTKKSPFKTINQAVEVAVAGDTILVLEGVYRERVIPIRSGEKGKPIVFMGEPGKKVVIKGSDIWAPKWKSLGNGKYVASPDEKMFNDVASDYVDGVNPFEILLASTPYSREGLQEELRGYGGDTTIVYTCGQVFVNGEQFTEVPYMKELEPKTWHYDPKTKGVNVNFGDLDPEKQVIEIATRRRIFAPSKRGLGYITVQGFLMEHCGNQYPTNFWMSSQWAQRGALGVEAGHNWVIRRNVVRYAKGFAIDAGNVDQTTPKEMPICDNLIKENYIIDNGSAGIMSNRSLRMEICNNVIMRNNTMRFWGQKRWEQAGIKCHNCREAYFHDNYIVDNYMTDGIWLDNNFPDARISRNVIVNNEKRGIFLEMSDYDYDRIFIDNNIIIGNGQNPIYCHDASGATFMHNLISNTPTQFRNGQGILIHQAMSRTKSYHHSIYNNIFTGSLPVVEICYPSHRGGPQRLDCNVYNTSEQRSDFYIDNESTKPYPWTAEELYELVKGELASVGKPAPAFYDFNRVALTFDQWKAFWKKHDCVNDENSTLTNKIMVSYYPETYSVTIQCDVNPSTFTTKNHEKVDVDFFGKDIPQNSKALPGPFQNLKRGNNVFKVWSGLPALDFEELPDFAVFNK